MSTLELTTSSDPRTRLAVLPQLDHWIIWSVALAFLTVVFGFAVKLIPGIAAPEFRVDQLLSRHHDAVLDWVALSINSVLSTRYPRRAFRRRCRRIGPIPTAGVYRGRRRATRFAAGHPGSS